MNLIELKYKMPQNTRSDTLWLEAFIFGKIFRSSTIHYIYLFSDGFKKKEITEASYSELRMVVDCKILISFGPKYEKY